MPNVLFTHLGKTVSVTAGSTILQAAQQLGLHLDAPCGGQGKCGKCKVIADGREVLACQYIVEADVSVTLPQSTSVQILSEGQSFHIPIDPIRGGYLIAIDIGTTTVVCFLLSPQGEELATTSMLNPQRPYGADVMSRIQYAVGGKGHELTAAIREGLNSLVAECCRKAGIAQSDIGVVSVVGNPCMQQLFLCMGVNNLAEVPFSPALTKAETVDAAACFPACTNASLLVVPDISGYVGADTMGCILGAKLHEAQDTVLLVDIGTNGEMVLTHGGRMTACSTAAGPALEGASIHFGMRGAEGAIDKVWLENGQRRCSVIGGGKATGICGSGLIDAVAVLLNQGLLNKRGRIQSTDELDGQRVVMLTDTVYLTQDDIRQVQLAKGAIAAGIQLMCQHLGITPADIDRVILAGAFGSFLNPDSACRIGLLPMELAGKISAAGNLAGVGAKMLALNREQLPLTQSLLDRIEALELAQIPSFQHTFAVHMCFDV